MPNKYIYTHKKVCRKGKLDGRGWRWKFPLIMKESFPVYPKADQTEQAIYERQIKKAGEDWLADLSDEWSDKDKKLKTEYCEALVKVRNALEDKEFENKEFEEAKEVYNEALDEFEELQAPAYSKTLEWIVIILLAIAEYFFNYMIFSVLGVSKTDTMIIAGTISIALPLSAMGFGHMIRIEQKTLTHRLWALFLGLVPFIVFIAIAFLRAALFEATWGVSDLDFNITPFQATLAFIFLNLLIWLIAAYISYRAAYKDPETFRTLKLRLNSARNVMEREGREYKEAVKEYEKARITYEKAKHLRKEEFDNVVARGKDLIKRVKWYISVYRTSNQEVRKDGVIPPCFHGSIPELSLPADLYEDNLDWDCNLPDRRQNIQSINPN